MPEQPASIWPLIISSPMLTILALFIERILILGQAPNKYKSLLAVSDQS
jgi:hypothetical protein